MTNLDISENEIGVEGAKFIAAVLPQAPLTNLDIGGNGIGVEGAKFIAAVLPQVR